VPGVNMASSVITMPSVGTMLIADIFIETNRRQERTENAANVFIYNLFFKMKPLERKYKQPETSQ